ncbi:hypothetical protein D3C87_1299570 [compost metagenome]
MAAEFRNQNLSLRSLVKGIPNNFSTENFVIFAVVHFEIIFWMRQTPVIRQSGCATTELLIGVAKQSDPGILGFAPLF